MTVWLSLCCCGLESVLTSAVGAGDGIGACCSPEESLPPCCRADADADEPASEEDQPRPREHRCLCRGLISTGVAPEQPALDFDTIGVVVLWAAATEERLAGGWFQGARVSWIEHHPPPPRPTLVALRCCLTI